MRGENISGHFALRMGVLLRPEHAGEAYHIPTVIITACLAECRHNLVGEVIDVARSDMQKAQDITTGRCVRRHR